MTVHYPDDLCVDSAARGQGIGTRLYRFAVDLAGRLGCDRATLHAWNFNGEALAFYRKLGMTPLVTTMEQWVSKSCFGTGFRCRQLTGLVSECVDITGNWQKLPG